MAANGALVKARRLTTVCWILLETETIPNSLDAPSGAEREGTIPINMSHRGVRQGMKCAAQMKLLSPKSRLRLGLWKVGTMYEQGRCAQIVKEMKRYNLSILGVSEMRWNTFGSLRTRTGKTILYSGKPTDDDPHVKGVGLILSRVAADSLMEWEPVSERIITARFDSKCQNMSFIQVKAKDEDKEAFYHQLQMVYNRTPRRDVTLIMGDFNAKIGSNNANRETVMGKYGLGSMNKNGEIFSDFCVSSKLIIGGTIFPHKQCHKVTWRSPNARTENQIDHVTIVQRWRSTLQDVRAKRGADVGSDHHLVVTQLKLKLAAVRKAKNPRRCYDVGKLKMDDLRHEFQLKLQNHFELLAPSLRKGDGDVNEDWKGIKEMYTNTCEELFGKMERNLNLNLNLTDNSGQMIYERRQLRKQMLIRQEHG